MMIFSYRKVGGLHFVRILRFGFSFYVAKKQRKIVNNLVDSLDK